ncbi:hypothetical protein JHK86_018408 [Glycine max]|nr:hypothetical protein JHK86_018408 [Glycine max]
MATKEWLELFPKVCLLNLFASISDHTPILLLCKDVIATRMRLEDKGVDCPSLCSICRARIENPFHLFFCCQVSISCWQTLGLWHPISRVIDLAISTKDVVFGVLGVLE